MSTQTARRGWSYAEFAGLPDDGNRYEVIDGELFVAPAPRPLHTRIAFKLAALLEAFVELHGLGWVMTAPIDVLLRDGDYVQPDVVFVRRDREGIITDRGIEGAPDLVVEVLSPATALRDRGIKRERYALLGVPEHWIIDPDASRVEVHRLSQGAPIPPIVAEEEVVWQPVADGPALTLALRDFIRGFV